MAWVGAAGIVLCAVTSSHARAMQGSPQASQSIEPGGDLSATEVRQLRFFRAALLGENTSRQSRNDAATLLLAMQRSAATDVLEEAIAADNHTIVTAAADVVAAAAEPPPRLRRALLNRLQRNEQPLNAALAAALSRFGPPALQDLAQIASDTTLTLDARLAAIEALPAIGTDAIEPLISLLPEDPGTPPSPLIDAVCDSLTRLTRLDHGDDAAAWRQWWAEAAAQPDATQLREQLTSLRQRNTALTTQVKDATAEIDLLMLRHIETLRALWPLLKLEDQFRRLPDLLASDLVAERRFGAERISRLLRDAIAIPDPVQRAVAERITDSDTVVRTEALRLLDEMNMPGLEDALAQALETETDPNVAMRALDIARKRPTRALAQAALRWLSDVTTAHAAELIWMAADAGQVDLELASRVAAISTAAFQGSPSPEFARLAGRFCDDAAARAIEPLLDDSDPAIAGAVARGFAFAGRTGPLLLRARSPAVFPWAVHALANGEPTLVAFERLVHLGDFAIDDPEASRSWQAGLKHLGPRLPATDMLAADDTLISRPDIPDGARIALLQGLMAHQDALSTDVRTETARRLSRALLDAQDAEAAYDLLTGLNGDLTDPRLLDLKFKAALRTGKYDAAIALSDDADAWINQLELTARVDPVQAAALRDVIAARMGERLTEQQQLRFNAAVIPLGATEPQVNGAPDGAEANAESDDDGAP